MEENSTMYSEAVDAELDGAWGEDAYDVDAAERAQPSADQPTAERESTAAPAGAGETAAADQPQQGAADQPTPELFTLRNREETRQVTRDELVAMAQKGWDYDRVRQERDQLQQYRSEAGPALELIRQYAQRNGMSVEAYVDFCRQQDLMRGGMDENTARQTVQLEQREAQLQRREAALAEQARKETDAAAQARARQQSLQEFMRAYPNVKADAIPKEVWAQVASGTPLLSAYTMHENRRLQNELAAERQNKANRQRTPGSLGGNAAAEMDEIDRLWAEDD